MVEGLRYKPRMMGVQVDGPTNDFCDNAAVVMNTTKPESTLKKKHNAIAYHRVLEAQVNETSHESEESRDVRAALASWRVLGSGCSASTLCASSTLF